MRLSALPTAAASINVAFGVISKHIYAGFQHNEFIFADPEIFENGLVEFLILIHGIIVQIHAFDPAGIFAAYVEVTVVLLYGYGTQKRGGVVAADAHEHAVLEHGEFYDQIL